MPLISRSVVSTAYRGGSNKGLFVIVAGLEALPDTTLREGRRLNCR